MSEEDDLLKNIFGWVGTAISTFFYIAPIVPFSKLIKGDMTVKEVPGILLICTFMNCILWANYGLLKDRFLQYFPNGLGGAITLIYITIFLIHLAGQRINFALLYNFFLIIAIVGLSLLFYFVIDVEITGKVVLIFNVLMFAAPGEKMYTVCRTGSYELIPIWSTIGGLACSGCWFMYGVYVSDIYVIIPNALGILCSIVQVVVYLIFRGKKKNKVVEEEGDTQENI